MREAGDQTEQHGHRGTGEQVDCAAYDAGRSFLLFAFCSCAFASSGEFEVDSVLRIPASAPGLPCPSDIRQRFHRRNHKVEGFAIFVCGITGGCDGEGTLRVGQITTVKSCLLRTCANGRRNAGLQARAARSVHQIIRSSSQFRIEFIEAQSVSSLSSMGRSLHSQPTDKAVFTVCSTMRTASPGVSGIS